MAEGQSTTVAPAGHNDRPETQPAATMTLLLSMVADGTLEVRPDGTVWRLKDAGRPCQPRRIENRSRKGYLRVIVGVPGERRTVCTQAHRLVLTALRGHIHDGMQINHKDLNKANNHPDNLEVVTASENIIHSYQNGRPAPWCRATVYRGRPRISEERMAEIRRLRASGLTYSEIIRRTGVSQTQIARICKRKEVGS